MRKSLLVIIFVTLSLSWLHLPAASGQSDSSSNLAGARRVLSTTPLVDGHNDLLFHFFIATERRGDFGAYNLATRTSGQTDLPRLKQGMVGAQFFTVTGLDDAAPIRGMMETIDFVRRMVERYQQQLAYADSSAGIRRAFASRRTAVLMAVEGGSQIENSLTTLRTYYQLGVRYMTLTHEAGSCDWAPAALDKSRNGGLTPFGKEVVREMNRLGMLVDLSHASASVARDAITISEAPVIFSHSSAQKLVNTPRNVPDDVLKLLKKNGGIVMVSFVPYFTTQAYSDWYYEGEAVYQTLLQKHGADRAAARREMRVWEESHPSPRVTVADVADHIEHIRRVAGIDHVGIGSDFDGMYGKIEGLEDVSKFPSLFAELARRGWAEAEMRKLAGENFLRVFTRAEATAERLRRTRTASTMTFNER